MKQVRFTDQESSSERDSIGEGEAKTRTLTRTTMTRKTMNRRRMMMLKTPTMMKKRAALFTRAGPKRYQRTQVIIHWAWANQSQIEEGLLQEGSTKRRLLEKISS